MLSIKLSLLVNELKEEYVVGLSLLVVLHSDVLHVVVLLQSDVDVQSVLALNDEVLLLAHKVHGVSHMRVLILELLHCGLHHVDCGDDVLILSIHVESLSCGCSFSGGLSFSVPLLLLIPDLLNYLRESPDELSDGEVVLEVEHLNLILSLRY